MSSSPYIGEIRMFCGNYAPYGWAFCNGQLLSVSANTALFSILGTYYGGNGVSTFALPDLRGRIPLQQDQGVNYTWSQTGGNETVALTASHIPAHSHVVQAVSAAGNTAVPGGNAWAADIRSNRYAASGPANVAMSSGALSDSGGTGQAHNNLPPYLVVNFIISLRGVFPSHP